MASPAVRKQDSALTAASSASLPARVLNGLSTSGRALLTEGFAPLSMAMHNHSGRWDGRLTVKLEALAIRGCVCSVLFLLNALALLYLYDEAQEKGLLEDALRGSVQCRGGVDERANQLCTFRVVCSAVACTLLLPYLVEMAQLSSYILAGFSREVHFERPEVLAREEMPVRSFPGRLLLAIANLFMFFVFCVVSPALLCYNAALWLGAAVLGLGEDARLHAWAGMEKWGKLLGTIALFMLPDMLLTLSLFPLAVLVIYSSNSIPEMVVNMIAVLFFAQLDDALVFMVLHPRRSLGQALELYCTDRSGASLSSNMSAVTGTARPGALAANGGQAGGPEFLGPEGPSVSFRA